MKEKKPLSIGKILLIIFGIIVLCFVIIATISMPGITRSIKDARASASVNAAIGNLKGAEVYYGFETMFNDGVFNNNQTKTIDFSVKADADLIEYHGTKATAGVITIDSDGNVTIIKPLVINEHFCGYEDNSTRFDSRIKCASKATDVMTGENW